MALWMVRAGRHGEREALALEKGLSVIGWKELQDLSHITTREALDELCRRTYPDAPANRISNYVGQLWAFRERIKDGDLIVLPLKTRSAIAIGHAKGSYEYRPDLPEDARHTRPTEWLRTDIPRTAFGQDLLYSFGAFMTVCQIRRNNAEERIRAVLAGKPDVPQLEPEEAEEPEAVEGITDLGEYAEDQISEYIGGKFKGHALARLVNELLQAQGYRTDMSAPGPDGGVDILVGAGPLGFDPPRLCVQVKSSDSPVDVSVLRELQGILKNYGAQQGLLVSWGGFKSSVTSEARRQFFELRLWDAGELVQALLQNYDRLSAEVQAELPLKRIWALVLEE